MLGVTFAEEDLAVAAGELETKAKKRDVRSRDFGEGLLCSFDDHEVPARGAKI